jgi:hypothetical protein
MSFAEIHRCESQLSVTHHRNGPEQLHPPAPALGLKSRDTRINLLNFRNSGHLGTKLCCLLEAVHEVIADSIHEPEPFGRLIRMCIHMKSGEALKKGRYEEQKASRWQQLQWACRLVPQTEEH